jgi:hypothetical protein
MGIMAPVFMRTSFAFEAVTMRNENGAFLFFVVGGYEASGRKSA